MFQIGDQVIYGIHGVCDVTAVECHAVAGNMREYLVLEPRNKTGDRFLVPTYNAAAMSKLRKILTKEALEAMFCSAEVHIDCWIREESQRKQAYREWIVSGDPVRLMAMVHTLYLHKAEQTAAGRKIHLCDDHFLHDAEKVLISEVSVVMGMDTEQAR